MQYKNEEAANACMLYIRDVIARNDADQEAVYRLLKGLCEAQANRLASLDPDRNR